MDACVELLQFNLEKNPSMILKKLNKRKPFFFLSWILFFWNCYDGTLRVSGGSPYKSLYYYYILTQLHKDAKHYYRNIYACTYYFCHWNCFFLFYEQPLPQYNIFYLNFEILIFTAVVCNIFGCNRISSVKQCLLVVLRPNTCDKHVVISKNI